MSVAWGAREQGMGVPEQLLIKGRNSEGESQEGEAWSLHQKTHQLLGSPWRAQMGLQGVQGKATTGRLEEIQFYSCRPWELSAHRLVPTFTLRGHPNSSMASSSIRLYPWDDPHPSKMPAWGSSRLPGEFTAFWSTPDRGPCPPITNRLTAVNPSCPFEMYVTPEPAQTGLILFLIRYGVVFQG